MCRDYHMKSLNILFLWGGGGGGGVSNKKQFFAFFNRVSVTMHLKSSQNDSVTVILGGHQTKA